MVKRTVAPESTTEKRGRPKSDAPTFPRTPLKKVIDVVNEIEHSGAGKKLDRLLLAKELGCSPGSGSFRQLLISGPRYNLTQGTYTAKHIALTDFGKLLAVNSNPNLLLQALTEPVVFKKIFKYYDGKPWPKKEAVKNTLVGECDIFPKDLDTCYKVISQNILDFNLLEDINGQKYLRLSKLSSSDNSASDDDQTPTSHDPSNPAASITPDSSAQNTKQIFIAHGKNKKPLHTLEQILKKFDVPYKIALNEPHGGRPISAKVSTLMRECSSAIFIFTADETTQDINGKTVYRPSDNVVFELGAASAMYENKIVIFKEDKVSFGSDFSDLGHITFDPDNLDAKAGDLISELINFNILSLIPT